jgi:hypothetical protein
MVQTYEVGERRHKIQISIEGREEEYKSYVICPLVRKKQLALDVEHQDRKLKIVEHLFLKPIGNTPIVLLITKKRK